MRAISIALLMLPLLALGQTVTTFEVTTTLPDSVGVSVQGAKFNVNGFGTGSGRQRGLDVNLLAGYTGSAVTAGLSINNGSAGSGTNGWAVQNANYGAYLQSTTASIPTATGHNIGALGSALGSPSLNLSVFGYSTSSANAPVLNVGAAGYALNATVNVGGLFALMNSAPTISASAGLIADNGATTSDIFIAQDNGVAVFRIPDGGGIDSRATNAMMTVSTTGATNNTGRIQTAWLTAAVGLQLYDCQTNAVWSGTQTITVLTPIPVQHGGSFTGTAITSVGTHAF